LSNQIIFDVNDIKKDPIKLVDKYHWYTIDLDNENDLNELYSFLLEYYVNNINAVFRFNYSKETLKWFLKPKTFYPDLILGVKYNNKLVSTIFGIPQIIRILDKVIKVVQINFLCVHHNIRNKRLAPILIKEITRRSAD
jgi:glycylpeptide N-tetradecanoyltransferase